MYSIEDNTIEIAICNLGKNFKTISYQFSRDFYWRAVCKSSLGFECYKIFLLNDTDIV